ncbi:hypothetical protein C5F47_04725 [Nitrosopumilus cobalaminigenes]|uniref:Uncharacterized protein n=1 Tax=Nitrosopumilus cobalaminigenes TaxID=1470066 RepID=A0A7D5QYZ1_9ARCH|nr:hypothetical protein [Nitrosopumilus cobalaminigenes]QLH02900.1 hypothetical protein C5F47_04725 [Nitrosopumilus cobalaminigenes]
MGFLSNLKKDLQSTKREKAAKMNGKQLKGLLKKFKEERDRVEKETGIRPQIDQSTQMFMQKILNVWIDEGRNIDEEKFWHEVDHYRQFTHSVEFYELSK